MATIASSLLTMTMLVSSFFLGQYYPEVGRIVNLDYTTDTVTVMTGGGNLWEFTGCEDLTEGDMLGLIFSTNNTPWSIYDDIIVDIKYAGILDDFTDTSHDPGLGEEEETFVLEEEYLLEEMDFEPCIPEGIDFDIELIEVTF